MHKIHGPGAVLTVHNSGIGCESVQPILGTPNEGYWALLLADWIAANAADYFAWTGDLGSPEAVRWVATVAQWSPKIHHVVYTKEYYLTAGFVGVKNLTVTYLTDDLTYREALKYTRAHSECDYPVRFCYHANSSGLPADFPKGTHYFRAKSDLGDDWFEVALFGLSPDNPRKLCTKLLDVPVKIV